MSAIDYFARGACGLIPEITLIIAPVATTKNVKKTLKNVEQILKNLGKIVKNVRVCDFQ